MVLDMSDLTPTVHSSDAQQVCILCYDSYHASQIHPYTGHDQRIAKDFGQSQEAYPAVEGLMKCVTQHLTGSWAFLFQKGYLGRCQQAASLSRRQQHC